MPCVIYLQLACDAEYSTTIKKSTYKPLETTDLLLPVWFFFSRRSCTWNHVLCSLFRVGSFLFFLPSPSRSFSSLFFSFWLLLQHVAVPRTIVAAQALQGHRRILILTCCITRELPQVGFFILQYAFYVKKSPLERFDISLFTLSSSPEGRRIILDKISILDLRWANAQVTACWCSSRDKMQIT